LDIQRESKALRMKFEGKFSEHPGYPMRTVVNYKSVRAYLDNHLGQVESELIDVKKVKLMPYVMVITCKEKQHILPMAINRSYYTGIRESVENGSPLDELGTLTPGTRGIAYIQPLKEFDIAGCGILFKGYPQAIVFSKICDCCGDNIIPIIGEHYGPHTSQSATFYFNGDDRECYKNRGCLDQEIRTLIETSAGLYIVTLGPNDDIKGIVTGNKKFIGKEWVDN